MFTGLLRVPTTQTGMGTMGTKLEILFPFRQPMGTNSGGMGTPHLLNAQSVTGFVPIVPSVPTKNK
jgi:hypothetical protein